MTDDEIVPTEEDLRVFALEAEPADDAFVLAQMDHALAACRALKEAKVAEHGPTAGETDLLPTVTWYSGRRAVAESSAGGDDDHHPRDVALMLARAGLTAAECDMVVMSMDAHVTTAAWLDEHPEARDGDGNLRLRPGQLQEECHEEDACARGLIFDVLVVHGVTRSGISRTRCLRYRLDDPVWWDPEPQPPDLRFAGYVVETLEAAAREPTMAEEVLRRGGPDISRVGEALGVEPWRARLHQRIAVCGVVARHGHSVTALLLCEAERQVMEERARGGMVDFEVSQ